MRVERDNNPASPDTVYDQRPAGGEARPQKSEVVLFVSDGPAEATVPGVIGESREAAEDRILSSGLNPVVTEQPTGGAAPGTVISQSPGPGEIVDGASDINLVVATEPEFLPIPDVVGLPREDAERALSSFAPAVIGAREDGQPANTVAEVIPGVGTEHMVGDRVELILSRGPGDAPEPDSGDGEPPPVETGDGEVGSP